MEATEKQKQFIVYLAERYPNTFRRAMRTLDMTPDTHLTKTLASALIGTILCIEVRDAASWTDYRVWTEYRETLCAVWAPLRTRPKRRVPKGPDSRTGRYNGKGRRGCPSRK